MSEFIKENTESPGAAVFFECALASQEPHLWYVSLISGISSDPLFEEK
jgi:hypothetical protein